MCNHRHHHRLAPQTPAETKPETTADTLLDDMGVVGDAAGIGIDDDGDGPATEAGRRRRKLWMIAGSALCSLVGTCISADDTAWLLRRLTPPGLNGASEYEVHRYLVREAGRSGLAARLMHKRLDAKYSGIIKRFAKETTVEGLEAQWKTAVGEGKVAAAYWALLTHPQLNEALMNRAFGDVHMLSHISGGETRKLLQSQTSMQRQVTELEQRLGRAERAHAERLAQRDARIVALQEEVRRLRVQAAAVAEPRQVAAPPARAGEDQSATRRRLEKTAEDYRRKVEVERYRARAAEEECRRLRLMMAEAADSVASFQTATAPTATEGGEPDELAGKSILYVGGRPHVLRHLKAAVAARNAHLLHHDGGMEQTNRSLEGLVERADIVVCPIDCVSHDACLRVKSMCKQRCKPFLPLRNAGASSFQRALGLAGAGGEGGAARVN